MTALPFDEREWQRDELLLAADDWLDSQLLRTAAEMSRELSRLVALRNTTELLPVEAAKINAAITDLRAGLAEIRRQIDG